MTETNITHRPRRRWPRRLAAAVLVVVGFVLAMPIASHASVRQRWNSPIPQCYHYSITEYRSGFVFGEDLWRAQQQVSWCYTSGVGVWKGPATDRSCWVSITWANCSLDRKWIHKLGNPTRWQLYAKWTMSSNGADLLVDHDHPYIYMTIFKTNPQHVSYTASCGC